MARLMGWLAVALGVLAAAPPALAENEVVIGVLYQMTGNARSEEHTSELQSPA